MTLLYLVRKAILLVQRIIAALKDDKTLPEPTFSMPIKKTEREAEVKSKPKRRSILRTFVKMKAKFKKKEKVEHTCECKVDSTMERDLAIAVYFATIGLLVGDKFINRLSRAIGATLVNRPNLFKWILAIMSMGALFSRSDKREAYAE